MKSVLALLAMPLLAADPKPFGEFLQLEGHKVHYHCEGQGTSTVVLLHGTPRFSFHFALIQPGIAKFARVCTYDRAGDAWSESIPDQPKAQQFVDELDQFLAKISPGKPVVLVGHSVGGVLARAYLLKHADRVASLVLIDSSGVRAARPTDEALRTVAESARGMHQPEPSLDGPFTKLPKQFQAAHLWAIRKWNAYADGLDPFIGLQYQADLNYMAAQAPRANTTVWVVGRAEPANWAETQNQLAALWPKSKLVLVPKSSHDIQLDQPGAVVAAVREAAALQTGSAIIGIVK